jgi:hypothetical protein
VYFCVLKFSQPGFLRYDGQSKTAAVADKPAYVPLLHSTPSIRLSFLVSFPFPYLIMVSSAPTRADTLYRP